MHTDRILFAAALLGSAALAGSISITTEEMPRAIKGAAYTAGIRSVTTVQCVPSDVTLTVAKGRLPQGLALGKDQLSGTPHETGQFEFTIRAANPCASTTRSFRMTVTARPILAAEPEDIRIQVYSGDRAVETRTALVSSTWPEVAYTASRPSEAWLQVRPAEGKVPELGSAYRGDRLFFEVNPEHMKPGHYSQKVMLTTWESRTAPVINVSVVVLPPRGKPDAGAASSPEVITQPQKP